MEISRKKFIVIMFLVFFIGIAMGGGNTKTVNVPVERIVEKRVEIPVEKTVEKTVYVETDKALVRQLKTMDDQVFTLSSEALSVCSGAFGDLSRGNYGNLTDYTTRMNRINDQIDNLSGERSKLLNRLNL
ncbi:MAG: hypothetical protein WC549_00525 [Actinomycetota bacterium]